MLREFGKVIATEGDYAWVQVVRKSACDACQAKNTCGQKTLSSMLNARAMEVRVKNSIKCRQGDEVEMGIPEKSLITLSFVTYLVPLLLMIGMALLAGELAPLFTPYVDVSVSISGIAGLFLGFWGVRIFSDTHQANPDYEPVLLSLLTPGGHSDSHTEILPVIVKPCE